MHPTRKTLSTLVLALLVATPLSATCSAHAGSPVSFEYPRSSRLSDGEENRDLIVYKANARMRANGRDAVAMRFYDLLFRKQPNLSSGEAIRQTQNFMQAYDRQGALAGTSWKGHLANHYDLAKKTVMFNESIRKQLSKFLPPVEFAAELAQLAGNAYLESTFEAQGGTNGLGQWGRALQEEKARRLFDDTLEQGFRQARENPDYRDGFYALFSTALQASPTDGADRVLASNPLLAQVFSQQAQLRRLEQMLAKNQLGDAEQRQLLTDLQWTLQEAGRELQKKEREARDAERRQYTLLALQTSLDGVGRLVSLLSPEARRTVQGMQAIGSAVMQLNAALDQYASAVKSAGKAIGTSLFAANCLSIGLDLFQAFAGGPSRDELLLESMRKLSEQVGAMHEEMRASFQAVDTRLVSLQQGMADGFRLTLERIAEGDAANRRDFEQTLSKLDSLRLQTLSLDSGLARMETSIFQGLADLAERDFLTLSANCATALAPREFDRCRRELQLHAVEFARKAVSARVNAASDLSGDAAALEFIAATPDTPTRFNWLVAHAQRELKLALPSLPQGDPNGVANPRAWSEATQALLASMRRNPELVASAAQAAPLAEALKRIQAAGHEIAQIVRELGQRDANGRYAFYSYARARYFAALDRMTVELRAADARVRRERQGFTLASLLRLAEGASPDAVANAAGSNEPLITLDEQLVQTPGQALSAPRWREAGFGTAQDWLSPKLQAVVGLRQAQARAEITGRWADAVSRTQHVNGGRECVKQSFNNGMLTWDECKFTRQEYAMATVRRQVQVVDRGDLQPLATFVREITTTDPLLKRECEVICRTRRSPQTCDREVKTLSCADRAAVAQAVAKNVALGNVVERSENESMLNALLREAPREAERERLLVASNLKRDPVAVESLRLMRAATATLDAYLRLVHELPYVENDGLLSALFSEQGVPLSPDATADAALDAYLNPQSNLAIAAWNRLATELDRFEARQGALGQGPSLALVEGTLEAVDVELQALRSKAERGSSGNAMRSFLKAASAVKAAGN